MLCLSLSVKDLARAPMVSLMSSSEPVHWNAALASYRKALDCVANGKQDPSKLKSLDEWYSDPERVAEQGSSLDKATLVKIVEWKLSRGTFRPGLLEKAKSNGEAAVKDAYSKACELLMSVDAQELGEGIDVSSALLQAATKAVSVLEKNLFGIGPATATAVLARVFPHAVAFMSDDAMLGCGLFSKPAEIKYTLKTFSRFNEIVQGQAHLLNSGLGKRQWTGDDVGRALWADLHLVRRGLASPQQVPALGPGPPLRRRPATSDDRQGPGKKARKA